MSDYGLGFVFGFFSALIGVGIMFLFAVLLPYTLRKIEECDELRERIEELEQEKSA